VVWQDGRITNSRVVWYGRGSRSEYRLTRFGKDFPFLTADCVGDLLVIIPKSHAEFSAYVLDTDEDVDEVQATLGVQIVGTWAALRRGNLLRKPPINAWNDTFASSLKPSTSFLQAVPSRTQREKQYWNALKASEKSQRMSD